MATGHKHEKARLKVQERLNAMKDQALRNKLGQFPTPAPLACDIIRLALSSLPREQRIRFLEPGFGTGAFYSALLQSVPKSRVEIATGYEIYAHYVEPNDRLWKDTGLHLHLADFTRATPPDSETDSSGRSSRTARSSDVPAILLHGGTAFGRGYNSRRISAIIVGRHRLHG